MHTAARLKISGTRQISAIVLNYSTLNQRVMQVSRYVIPGSRVRNTSRRWIRAAHWAVALG